MTPSLPHPLVQKAVTFPKSSHGANRVTLVLTNDRSVLEVYLAWGFEIVKIGNRAVSRSDDLDFDVGQIVDVISEIK